MPSVMLFLCFLKTYIFLNFVAEVDDEAISIVKAPIIQSLSLFQTY